MKNKFEIYSFKGVCPTNDGLFTLDDETGNFYWQGWDKNKEEGLSLSIMLMPERYSKIHEIRNKKTGEIITVMP